MGEDNEIHGDQPCDASTLHAAATPPTYDEHIYDRLWDGLPIETFFSPFASGANTPAFVSRNNSMENILLTPPDNYLLDSAASSRPRTRANSPGGTSTGPSSPDELSADELHASLGTSRCSSDYFSMSGRRAGTRSAGNTRPGSSEGSSANNTALADVAKLSRVPSYNTAVRVGPRSLAAHNSLPQLPQYESGSRSVPNSAPSSPPLGPGSSSRPVTPTNRIGRGRLGFSLRSGMTRHTSPPAASAGAPAVTDLERRIKLLQARERN